MIDFYQNELASEMEIEFTLPWILSTPRPELAYLKFFLEPNPKP